MSLNLDRSTWKRVTFGDVATASKERCDPTEGSVDRYIAGEHMDTDELKIRRWGDVGDGYLGPAFHRAFHPGQVLYGSRRTYLRKVAVAEFDGVCANTTFVVESKDTKVLLPEFLPFVMTSEPFHAFAISESKGSVNPYVNWSDIARYEFDLPPLDDQKRIAELLWAVERHKNELLNQQRLLFGAIACLLGDVLKRNAVLTPFAEVVSAIVDCAHKTAPTDDVDFARVIGTPDIREGRLLLDTARPVSKKTYVAWTERAIPRGGDLIFTREAPVGEVGIVPDGVRLCLGQRTVLVRPKAPTDAHVLWAILRSDPIQSQIAIKAAGSTVPHLNVADIRALEVPWPSKSAAVQHVSSIVSASETIASTTQLELDCLVALRGAVLADVFREAK